MTNDDAGELRFTTHHTPWSQGGLGALAIGGLLLAVGLIIFLSSMPTKWHGDAAVRERVFLLGAFGAMFALAGNSVLQYGRIRMTSGKPTTAPVAAPQATKEPHLHRPVADDYGYEETSPAGTTQDTGTAHDANGILAFAEQEPYEATSDIAEPPTVVATRDGDLAQDERLWAVEVEDDDLTAAANDDATEVEVDPANKRWKSADDLLWGGSRHG